MAQEVTLLVFPVTDIVKAKAFYTKLLGTEPYTDNPYYVGYKVGNMEVGLDPNSKVGPITYTDVLDIKSSLAQMTEAGGQMVQDVRDVGGGLQIAQIKDVDGNVFGFRQHP